MYENHEASKATETESKQNNAYIRQLYEAWKDPKAKSMQNALYSSIL